MIYTVTLNPSLDFYVSKTEIKLGKENIAKDFSFLPGGKGINVSQVLNNLGTDSIAWGLVGGFTGQKLVDDLNERQISNDFVRIKDQTRINIKFQMKPETAVNFTGPHVSISEINALRARIDDLKPSDWVVLSGSLAQNLPEDFYCQFAEEAKKHGAQVVVDAVGEVLLNALSAHPFIVKPNKTELQLTLNKKINSIEDCIAGGQQILQQGAQNVMVSLGAKGALLLHDKEVFYAPAALGNAVNTVGAGDSMIAGFLSSYQVNKDLIAGFKTAMAAGCAAAFSLGLPVKSQIETLIPQITVRQLA
ncbi:MAG: 1-phosphofructokinase [Lactobacillus sp.]|jgi:1-phosphofructokinase|nr:1-phosphofructokinase [Lactobacillus sp.]MCH3905586.1 1-phosphofructokinase [Lactobacillus sp.]MCH3990855.1 1-phosphofructokinase [Lactobacillus sp.]MCH4068429.1 1-phosphofructokinase [Lactobacillus sp.]MCI1304569.1 1-phosphofructokinase [Lactobacillus sp.]